MMMNDMYFEPTIRNGLTLNYRQARTISLLKPIEELYLVEPIEYGIS